MKSALLKILSCPYNEDSHLEMSVRKKENDEIIEGVLKCEKCERIFPIINGVPYLLPDDLKSKNKDVIKFLIPNKEYKAMDQRGYTTDIDWKPGRRIWKPDFFTQFLIWSKVKKSRRSSEFFFSPESFSLDIGCGEVARGTINIDLYLPTKMPGNFILASAERLPFQSNVFDIVFSSYVIEHCLNPAHFIQDQVRCSRDKVITITDNSEWIGDYWFRLTGNGRIFHDEHYYMWSVEYLENLIRRLGYESKVEACNLSPTYVVAFFSRLGRLPRIGRLCYRDLKAEISKNGSGQHYEHASYGY